MPLIAAPVVILPTSSPLVGYTTFNKIYIRGGLSPKEYEVVLKHEQAHIWLRHHARVEKRDRVIWNIACDVEIAREIYSQDDVSVITAIMSTINSGIVPTSFPDLPKSTRYAEQIYDWLLGQVVPESYSLSSDLQGEVEKEKSDGGKGEIFESADDLVELVKKEMADSATAAASQKSVCEKLKSIKYAPPSLGGSMDAILRTRFDRIKSFRRPSRREERDFTEQGRITSNNNPLVEIFIDRSGSFTPEKTKIAEEALRLILRRYRSTIQGDTFFFGANRLDKNGQKHGGNTPYQLIATHLFQTIPDIAVVITDDDPCEILDVPKNVKILVIPIGSSCSCFADASGGMDVLL
jgi:predicted metal-dependent peptidase